MQQQILYAPAVGRSQKRAPNDGRAHYCKPENHQAHLANVQTTNIFSCEAVERIFDGAHAHLFRANERLLGIHLELRECQLKYALAVEKDRASIALELYNCGRGCIGCPHPRWVRYHWIEVPLTLANPDYRYRAAGRPVAHPVQSIPRKARNYEQIAGLVRDAQNVIKERAKLLRLISKLRAFPSPDT